MLAVFLSPEGGGFDYGGIGKDTIVFPQLRSKTVYPRTGERAAQDETTLPSRRERIAGGIFIKR